MRLSICLAGSALLFLAAVGAAQPAQIIDEIRQRYEETVGRTMWVSTALAFCQTPGMSFDRCEILDSGTRITVERIPTDVQWDDGKAHPGDPTYFLAKLKGDRIGFVNAAEFFLVATDIDPEKAKAACRRRGQPSIGMTTQQLTASCWGKPISINRTQLEGATFDQYVYLDGRYAYLRNGIVTSIQKIVYPK